ncbi:hypothetical protein TEA_009151 [Camellia sinensis var. sinensis]|uniref:Uncharacterized protein n=1 Tax=Camellia sinensis var. sinensis TaxID=542762 RepID=A0A4S4EGL8_CAMSN|nr:hypothetical protein TEA_009151 [Camellia sinensis var. sinensis]
MVSELEYSGMGRVRVSVLYAASAAKYVKTVPLAAEMLDVRRHQKLEMVKELKLEKARFRLEVEIGKSPPLSDEELWLELRHKALELQDEWRLENRKAFANIWSDMVFGISLAAATATATATAGTLAPKLLGLQPCLNPRAEDSEFLVPFPKTLNHRSLTSLIRMSGPSDLFVIKVVFSTGLLTNELLWFSSLASLSDLFAVSLLCAGN